MRRRGAVVVLAFVATVLVAAACQPLRHASKGSALGNDLTGAPSCTRPTSPCAGDQPLLWMSVSGPYALRSNGDPFASACLGATGTASCELGPNPEHRAAGRRFAVETTEPNQVVTVQVYDPSNGGATGSAPGTPSNTGETTPRNDRSDAYFELFDEDGNLATARTDLELSLHGKCVDGPGRQRFTPATSVDSWVTLCRFVAEEPGVHPLRVWSTVGKGLNAFAVRATVEAGPAPRVYALEDFALYVPHDRPSQPFPLVEVPEGRHDGNSMVVDIFDPGDSTATGQVSIRAPGDAEVGCTLSWSAVGGSQGDTTGGTEQRSPCTFATKSTVDHSSLFDNRWVRVEVAIPQDYECGGDCWWTADLALGATSVDNSTWVVSFTPGGPAG
jgi:hypothetical protein